MVSPRRSMIVGIIAISIAIITTAVGFKMSGQCGKVAVAAVPDTASRKGVAIMADQSEGTPTISLDSLSMTVIYDNNPYAENIMIDWGFSCLVRGAEKTILFDTGANGSVLMANMERLGLRPGDVDIVVLSHRHGDHVGGLEAFLERNPDVMVYVPKSFRGSLQRWIKEHGAELFEVKEAVEICQGVYSTGEMGTFIKEQSMIVHTDGGCIVITGCAHPGIVEIIDKTREVIADDVLLATGGFHLLNLSETEIGAVISSFRQAGVRYVGPCHCSGETTRRLFQKDYGECYMDVGAGRVIDGASLR
jgi:7,8-dihydropterin-6-yl-methyl-4-(beta-D-ribofuranosyl)aminobenzene 5'-phosphate synthase